MTGVNANWSLSSEQLVEMCLPALERVASLMGASVFLAVGTGSGDKFIYSQGYLGDTYERGDLKPSRSDVKILGRSSASRERRHSEKRAHRESSDRRASSSKSNRRSREKRSSSSKSSNDASKKLRRDRGDFAETKNSNGSSSASSSLLASLHRVLRFQNLADRTSEDKIKSQFKKAYKPYNWKSVKINVDQKSERVLYLEFPSVDDARQAFAATPCIITQELGECARVVQVKFNYRPPLDDLPPVANDNDEEYPRVANGYSSFSHGYPRLSIMVWVDDSVGKQALQLHMESYGPVIGVQKCRHMEDCFVVNFTKISTAKTALESYNRDYPSCQAFVISYYNVGWQRSLWVEGFEKSVTSGDIQSFCEMHGPVSRVYANESSGEALIFFENGPDAREAEMALRVLDGKDLDVDFAQKEFREWFVDNLQSHIDASESSIPIPRKDVPYVSY